MARITLLDGGVGHEIVTRAGHADRPLWATGAMADTPGLAEAVHRDYFAAGATVATANTYALLPDRLMPEGLGNRLAEWRAMALEEARAARDAHGAGRVAAAIGPVRGSYRPELFPDHATALAEYSEAIAAFAPDSDVLIFETVASLAHLHAAQEAARTTARPVWIAVTVSDTDGTRLRSGEPVAEAARLLAENPAAAALVNCSAPEAIGPALDLLGDCGKPIGAYANAFAEITEAFLQPRPTVDALPERRDITPARYAAHALDWVDRGATLVGGCCATGPAHIAATAEALRDAGHVLATP
ncbi:homocysteine S-methyltransferase family protein [Roseivivax marinus]|uniref:homocysteine S-methyltransferase family protein n=1 Tax=Roseivivax marinus TaxID=1379903 RepID=UPI0027400DBE|nr:homocysteine S-methyltransferase family protein [Roseivivax marinus]